MCATLSRRWLLATIELNPRGGYLPVIHTLDLHYKPGASDGLVYRAALVIASSKH